MNNKDMLNEIILRRDSYKIGSQKWILANNKKTKILEQIKPATKENILYYKQSDLKNIPEGFYKTNKLPNIKLNIGKRSLLEHCGVLFRHPIPYIILKYQNKYFFILREKGSGEMRLVGKKGMVGGHVGKEGIEKGMYRELKEEVKVTPSIINKIELKGLIKSNQGVDKDHLGCIYKIELNTDNIKAEEKGILTGLWINKEDLHNHYDSFENWSKIVYDNIIK